MNSLRRLLCAGLPAAVAPGFMARAQMPSVGTKAIHAIVIPAGAHTGSIQGVVMPAHGEGDMRNEGSERYTFAAEAGQRVRVDIRSDNGKAVFSMFRPSRASSNPVLVERAGAVQSWSGTLIATGDYEFTVFTRANALSRFTLSLKRL